MVLPTDIFRLLAVVVDTPRRSAVIEESEHRSVQEEILVMSFSLEVQIRLNQWL